MMKSKSILIAYPNEQRDRSFRTFFEDLGFHVEESKTVSEIIRKVRKGDVQVILLDDEVDGVKAYDLVPLLKMNPRVQVIVLSSEESLRVIRRLRGAGIFYHAMKPVDPEEIRSAVECAFEKIERESPRKEGFFFMFPEMVPV